MNHFKTCVFAAAFCMSSSVLATGVLATEEVQSFDVTDAVATHGLWTNGNFFEGDRDFNIDPGTTLTQFSDGTAKLVGHASDSGVIWDLDIKLSDFNTEPNAEGPKTNGGPLLPEWDFYHTLEGTISNNQGDTFTVVNTGAAFQLGFGANAKNLDFGASAWLDAGDKGIGHWDLNLDLDLSGVSPVPELQTYTMLLAGLGLLGFMARRRKENT